MNEKEEKQKNPDDPAAATHNDDVAGTEAGHDHDLRVDLDLVADGEVADVAHLDSRHVVVDAGRLVHGRHRGGLPLVDRGVVLVCSLGRPVHGAVDGERVGDRVVHSFKIRELKATETKLKNSLREAKETNSKIDAKKNKIRNEVITLLNSNVDSEYKLDE